MEKKNEQRQFDNKEQDAKKRHQENTNYNHKDLPDNEHDAERMQSEVFTIDLPDVEDIPGQEHIHVPRIREMEDTTIASDDEEGVRIFGNGKPDDLGLVAGTTADVNRAEKRTLENADKDMPNSDDQRLRKAGLEQTDEDGNVINEGSMATDVTGEDLDTSGVDEDDAQENIGEEDEENNLYSLGGDKHK